MFSEVSLPTTPKKHSSPAKSPTRSLSTPRTPQSPLPLLLAASTGSPRGRAAPLLPGSADGGGGPVMAARSGAAEALVLLLLWFAALEGAAGSEPPLKCEELRLGQYPERGRAGAAVGWGAVVVATGPV